MAVGIRGRQAAAVHGDYGPEFEIHQGRFAGFVALPGGLQEFRILRNILPDTEHPGGDLAQVVAVGKALAVKGIGKGLHHLGSNGSAVNGLPVDLGHGGHIFGPLHPALQLQGDNAHFFNGLHIVDQAVVLQAQGVLVLPAGVAVALTTGLGAAAPVAGPGTNHGGEITLAGVAHTQGSVAENFNFNGGVGADVLNLVPAQFPAEDHPPDSHGGAHLDTGQVVYGHLGGAVDRHMGRNLAAQLHHAPVLDDKGVHTRLGGGADQIAQLLHLPVGNQGVEGQVNLNPPDVAVLEGFTQGFQSEVLCALPGVEFPDAQIHGIGAVLHRRAKGFHRPRRGQQFQHRHNLHMVYLETFYHSLWKNSTLTVRIHEIFIGAISDFSGNRETVLKIQVCGAPNL